MKSSNAGILTAIFVLALGANYERDINNIKTIQFNNKNFVHNLYKINFFSFII